jgi:adenine-specific DNA-methyltransferase
LNWGEFPPDTVFYFDPPYFITNAAYNDGKRGMKGWNAESEAELLSELTKIDSLGYKFMLSNVLYHRGKTNNLMLEWIQEHNFKVIDVGTSGWRYAKNEVIIKNF